MGYPYPDFCLCAFFGGGPTRGPENNNERGSKQNDNRSDAKMKNVNNDSSRVTLVVKITASNSITLGMGV